MARASSNTATRSASTPPSTAQGRRRCDLGDGTGRVRIETLVDHRPETRDEHRAEDRHLQVQRERGELGSLRVDLPDPEEEQRAQQEGHGHDALRLVTPQQA